MKKLVIYYSQANGNTKRIAQMIADKTGADITAIDTVTPYTGTYDEIVNRGQREVGKKVAIFQTHGGWRGHTLKDMKALCKGAQIISEKAIQFDSTGGDKLETPLGEIENWINQL
jgi:hypothetical protein